LGVVPRPLHEMPFLVRRRYFIVVPRLLPAGALAMRCTYLIVVPWPVPRPFYAATQTHLLAVVAPPAPACKKLRRGLRRRRPVFRMLVR
jgi:hypothetical protein